MEHDVLTRLFRSEFSKMVAVISRSFGLEHLETAEDIVSETFMLATENWQKNGIPENPQAWLYTVAKNKTHRYFKRKTIFSQKVAPAFQQQIESTVFQDENFSTQNIRDSRLQMMFAICNPVIAGEAQIALALRVLCGFGIDEIAEAFFTTKETINKRLYRAKEKLRAEQIQMELPGNRDINKRLNVVLHILYLLFNEGYYSTTGNQVLRKDLCSEALQLAVLLTEFESTNLPKTNALVALMCYHSSRFPARENAANGAVTLDEQERHLWDRDLIKAGSLYLSKAAEGNEITSYHLEARIAFCHAELTADKEKWPEILKAYDMLIEINNSPGVIINRIYAIYRVHGAMAALEETDKYYNVRDSHYYYTLLGELYLHVDKEKARSNFLRALSLARSAHDKQMLQYKIDRLKGEP